MRSETVHVLANPLAVLLLVCLLAIGPLACAAPAAQPPAGAKPGGATGAAVDKTGWPQGLTIGAGALGGAVYSFNVAWGKVIGDKIGIAATVEASGSPAQTLELVDRKEADFGSVAGAIVYEGYHGEGWAKGTRRQNVRSVFAYAPGYLHFWALASSGIKSLRDLDGRVVVLSGAGSAPDLYGRPLFKMLGISPKIINNSNFSDANQQMADGQADAIANFGALPHPAVTEFATTHDVVILGAGREDSEKFIQQSPFFSVGTIPARTYKGQDQPVMTLAQWATVVTNREIPNSLVYAATKATIENVDELTAAYAAAREITPENVVSLVVPLHAGALRYYRERGVQIPQKLVPPETP